jgi:hypothetical protein
LQSFENGNRISSNAKADRLLDHCDIRTIQEGAIPRRIGRTASRTSREALLPSGSSEFALVFQTLNLSTRGKDGINCYESTGMRYVDCCGSL